MALLSRYLTPERVVFLRSRTREGAVRELAVRLARTLPGIDADRVFAAIRERERLVSSWVGPGIAIPHARLSGMDGACVVVGRSRQGVAWDSGDGDPVRLVILIASDERDPDGHLQLLAEIARTLRDLALKQLVLTARSAAEVHRLLITHGYAEDGPRPHAAGRVRLSRLLFAHALSVAEEVKARAVVLHGDAVGSLRFIEDIPAQTPVILATADRARWRETPKAVSEVLQVPFPTLSRLDQVELVLLFGLSRGLFARGDAVVSLSGVPNSGFLDTLLVLDVGREFPAIFDAHAAGTLLGDVEPPVLEKVLQLAVDLAREGREGRPVGTIFVVGDHEKVAAASRQMVINPFRGYLDEEKNVLDPSLGETLKEFSTIDGAFIVRGDGVILSAGTFLKPERASASLPSGLGARHAAAAAVTAASAALAVVVSQSTGTVSLFKGGVRVLTLEKPGSPTEIAARPRGTS
jgi:diadenylate cyclase